jgi:hypothetical protein
MNRRIAEWTSLVWVVVCGYPVFGANAPLGHPGLIRNAYEGAQHSPFVVPPESSEDDTNMDGPRSKSSTSRSQTDINWTSRAELQTTPDSPQGDAAIAVVLDGSWENSDGADRRVGFAAGAFEAGVAIEAEVDYRLADSYYAPWKSSRIAYSRASYRDQLGPSVTAASVDVRHAEQSSAGGTLAECHSLGARLAWRELAFDAASVSPVRRVGSAHVSTEVRYSRFLEETSTPSARCDRFQVVPGAAAGHVQIGAAVGLASDEFTLRSSTSSASGPYASIDVNFSYVYPFQLLGRSVSVDATAHASVAVGQATLADEFALGRDFDGTYARAFFVETANGGRGMMASMRLHFTELLWSDVMYGYDWKVAPRVWAGLDYGLVVSTRRYRRSLSNVDDPSLALGSTSLGLELDVFRDSESVGLRNLATISIEFDLALAGSRRAYGESGKHLLRIGVASNL